MESSLVMIMVVVFILARGLKDAAPCGVIKDGVEFICIIDDEGVMVIVGPLFIISLALVLRTLTLVTLVKSRSDWVTSLGRWPFVVKEPLKKKRTKKKIVKSTFIYNLKIFREINFRYLRSWLLLRRRFFDLFIFSSELLSSSEATAVLKSSWDWV